MEEKDIKFPGLDISIRDAQKVQLEILLEFDRICKKHDIKYQLYAGTLIGAVRHNGFIPWDDDIDVCMLREEYEKFLEVGSVELDGKYFLQNYNTDENFYLQFSKIRKNDTLYIQDLNEDIDIHHGIFIDIFPYDNVKPNTLSGKFQKNLLNILNIINSSRMKKGNHRARNRTIKIIKMFFHYFLKLFPKKQIDRLITQIACMFNTEDVEFVGELSLSTQKDLFDRFTLKKEVFYDSIEWEFEGHKFPIPRDFDYVLTKNYGDYMTPPPLEKQKPLHGIIEIDFDTKESSSRT